MFEKNFTDKLRYYQADQSSNDLKKRLEDTSKEVADLISKLSSAREASNVNQTATEIVSKMFDVPEEEKAILLTQLNDNQTELDQATIAVEKTLATMEKWESRLRMKLLNKTLDKDSLATDLALHPSPEIN